MAVRAQVFPVGAVSGIVVVVAVFVVDGQKVLVAQLKLSAALTTDQVINFERLLPVVAGRGQVFFQLLERFFNAFAFINYFGPARLWPAAVDHGACPFKVSCASVQHYRHCFFDGKFIMNLRHIFIKKIKLKNAFAGAVNFCRGKRDDDRMI